MAWIAAASQRSRVCARPYHVVAERGGSLRGAQWDPAGAGTAYAAALAIAERLAASDPTNSTWKRDLSVSHERLANVSEQLGDRDTALHLAEQSLAVDERLVALDPTSVLWQSDLRVSRARVARLRAG